MNETHITIIGNVLTPPEWRVTAGGQKVTSFKVASTARRLDRDSGKWVDGNSLRVRVNCWRSLAAGVAQSVMLGDPVVVFGRLYTRDWVDSEGTHRTLYEMEALAVGHDYSRGRAKFARNRPTTATSANENTDELRIGGEPTVPAPEQRLGLHPDDPLNQGDGDAGFDQPRDIAGLGAMAALRDGGLDVQVIDAYLREAAESAPGDEPDTDDDTSDPDNDVAGAASRRRREPVPV